MLVHIIGEKEQPGSDIMYCQPERERKEMTPTRMHRARSEAVRSIIILRI